MKTNYQIGSNPSREQTEGVPLDGFQDPTGEYPSIDYNNSSSINEAARGTKIHELYLAAGDVNVPLDLPPLAPSVYPHSQIKETESGHVVEYDDTPGNERVLIKHRTGAGVEMRQDGTVVVSATNNRIEVTGGDQTIIVEGKGTIVYHGNLDLKVTGDYNVNVGGDYNLNVEGNYNQSVYMDKDTHVHMDTIYQTNRSKSELTLENELHTVLGYREQNVKAYLKTQVQGPITSHTDQDMIVTAFKNMSHTADNVNVTGRDLTVNGTDGNIGGDNIEFIGPMYMGPKGAITGDGSGAAFYGSFYGQATEALVADKADQANKAGTAARGPSGTGASIKLSMSNEGRDRPLPVTNVLEKVLTESGYKLQTIKIDPDETLKSERLFEDKYSNIFDKEPTIAELRSAMRDPSHRSKLGQKLSGTEISTSYTNKTPKKIGRTSPKSGNSRFGYEPIGNAIMNRGKKFKL
jgi:hypothetical protein